MLESKIQTKIRDWLKKEGWFVMKIIACSRNGTPDLYACKDGKSVFIEVKQPGKRPSELQKSVMKEINSKGIDAFYVESLEQVKNILCK